MAKCELSIQLEDPGRVYQGGDTVRGTVTVRVDKNVRCDGLHLRTIWETHGNGNVARGVTDETVAFQGDWVAGTTEQFPFELKCGNWPPTYHGTHLNIDHYVEAQVDVPWAFDPKARRPFPMQPRPDGSLDIEVPASQASGVVGKVLGFMIVGIFGVVGVMFLFHPCTWVIALAVAGWWFWAKYLPKKKLGDVEFQLLTPHVAAGTKLQAELVLKPTGPIPVNQIRFKLHGQEVVVRGSGTNRRTYRHSVADKEITVAEQTQLVPHQENRFVLDLPLPADSPPTVDLKDNNIAWTLQGSVDIPRWPDWKQELKFQVLPSGAIPVALAVEEAPSSEPSDVAEAADPEPAFDTPPEQPSPSTPAPLHEVASVGFQDTVDLVAKVCIDAEQLDRVLSAVQGKAMDMTIRASHPVSLGRIDASIGYEDGRAFEGSTLDDQLALMIFVPRSRVREFESLSDGIWRGWAQISGYDDRIGSLQIKVLEP